MIRLVQNCTGNCSAVVANLFSSIVPTDAERGRLDLQTQMSASEIDNCTRLFGTRAADQVFAL